MKIKTAPILALLLAFGQMAHADITSVNQDLQGAQGDVKGSVPDLSRNARDVLKQLGVAQTEITARNGGSEEILKGKKGNMTVEIQLSQVTPEQTHVGVIAKRGALKWDKDYAKSLLSKIVEKG